VLFCMGFVACGTGACGLTVFGGAGPGVGGVSGFVGIFVDFGRPVNGEGSSSTLMPCLLLNESWEAGVSISGWFAFLCVWVDFSSLDGTSMSFNFFNTIVTLFAALSAGASACFSWVLLGAFLKEEVGDILFLGVVGGLKAGGLFCYVRVLGGHGCGALASAPSLAHHCFLDLGRPSAGFFFIGRDQCRRRFGVWVISLAVFSTRRVWRCLCCTWWCGRAVCGRAWGWSSGGNLRRRRGVRKLPCYNWRYDFVVTFCGNGGLPEFPCWWVVLCHIFVFQDRININKVNPFLLLSRDFACFHFFHFTSFHFCKNHSVWFWKAA